MLSYASVHIAYLLASFINFLPCAHMVSTWNHVLGKKNYLCQTDDMSESDPKKCQQYFCLGLPHLANVISIGKVALEILKTYFPGLFCLIIVVFD